jgi:tetratricopeptide (TPR) repeat protein
LFKVNLKNVWVCSLVILVFALFSVRDYVRSFNFRNDVSLATHDLAVSDSFSLESLLSSDYNNQGKYALGLVHAKRSVSIFPYLTNLNNLGSAYAGLGEYRRAYQSFHRALAYGDYYLTYDNLAVTALAYGNRSRNIEFIKDTALPKFPTDPTLWLCLAVLNYLNGDPADAKLEIQQAYALNPSPQIAAALQMIMTNRHLTPNIW